MGDKRNIKGSASRDNFKFWYKTPPMPGRFYALDLDFILIEKNPNRIVAFLDYKRPGDRVSFSECIAYNVLLAIAPVYIIEAEEVPKMTRILRFVGGDSRPDPPVVCLVPDAIINDTNRWIAWESKIRQQGRGV